MAGWLFPALLAVIGLIGLAQAFRQWRQAAAAQAWPSAKGKISASTVDSAWNPEGANYWIKYDYTVDGRQYTGKTVSFDPPFRPQVNKRRADLKRYAVGTSVTVYYDPHNPERAVLERHIPWEQIITMLAGGLLAFVWAALLVFPAR